MKVCEVGPMSCMDGALAKWARLGKSPHSLARHELVEGPRTASFDRLRMSELEAYRSLVAEKVSCGFFST